MTNKDAGVAEGFGAVHDAFQANFDNDLELGAGFAVYRGDDLVVDLFGGFTDRKQEKSWRRDTLVPIFSTTKPISALTIASLIDTHEEVGWDTAVAEIWPEFGANGKERVTIAEVLSHQAGLPGFTEPIDPELWLSPDTLANELAKLAPIWPLDGSSGYHPLTWGYLAGEIARRIGDCSLGTHLKHHITNADGADADRESIDFWIGTPTSEHDRCADMQRPKALADLGELNDYRRAAFLQKWSAPNRGGAIWKEIEIPSANGHGTARSVARLYSAFAHAGRIGDQQIVRSDAVWQGFISQRTLGPDRVLPFETEFAAGVMRNNAGFYGPNPNTLGHSGWGGSAALGDPDAGVSMAYVMNRQSNKLQGDPRAQALIEAAYQCLSS